MQVGEMCDEVTADDTSCESELEPTSQSQRWIDGSENINMRFLNSRLPNDAFLTELATKLDQRITSQAIDQMLLLHKMSLFIFWHPMENHSHFLHQVVACKLKLKLKRRSQTQTQTQPVLS